MKKLLTKKNILTFIISASIILLPVMAYATSSGYKSSPQATVDKYVSGPAYACYSASATAQGSSTYTYFDITGSALPSTFYAANNRVLEIKLMEDDPLSNDYVKRYLTIFDGRALDSIYLASTITSGAIEGDNSVELFIEMWVGSHGYDTSTTVSSGLFKYNVGIN